MQKPDIYPPVRQKSEKELMIAALDGLKEKRTRFSAELHGFSPREGQSPEGFAEYGVFDFKQLQLSKEAILGKHKSLRQAQLKLEKDMQEFESRKREYIEAMEASKISELNEERATMAADRQNMLNETKKLRDAKALVDVELAMLHHQMGKLAGILRCGNRRKIEAAAEREWALLKEEIQGIKENDNMNDRNEFRDILDIVGCIQDSAKGSIRDAMALGTFFRNQQEMAVELTEVHHQLGTLAELLHPMFQTMKDLQQTLTDVKLLLQDRPFPRRNRQKQMADRHNRTKSLSVVTKGQHSNAVAYYNSSDDVGGDEAGVTVKFPLDLGMDPNQEMKIALMSRKERLLPSDSMAVSKVKDQSSSLPVLGVKTKLKSGWWPWSSNSKVTVL